MSGTCTAITALRAALANARRLHHRQLVVLAGSRQWTHDLALSVLAAESFSESLWLGEQAPAGVNAIAASQAQVLLGRDIDCVVFDCWSGLNPDALAAAAGAVIGGGVLVLCTPELSQWPYYADPDYRRLLVYPFSSEVINGRFLRHFIARTTSDPSLLLLEQGEEQQLSVADIEMAEQATVSATATFSISAQQQQAVTAIIRVLEGHSRRPLVMTSDRGRGKSSALGIASGQIMQQSGRRLVITAPRRESVAPVFFHAARVTGQEPIPSQADILQFGASSLRFIPVDELLRNEVELDLLMVDEAAAIPAPMLERLLRRYNRIVFSTTVHGYEGTGRGFEIRFKHSLHALSNQVREIHLTAPIRWAENDPVERWLYDVLLLDAKSAQVDDSEAIDVNCCEIIRLNRDELLENNDCLRELFGLLVTSHYQTTPSDLRNLLDGPNVAIWLGRYQGRVVAAVLIAEEGGFDTELAAAVWRGQRRPQGHLLPQTLAAHAGFGEAACLRYWRVMRIAVHPLLQHRGMGKQLLVKIAEMAQEQGIDLMGSSFAATTDVVAFWRRCNFVPVRLGIKRDASSGCHSAMMLSAQSERGEQLLQQLQDRFTEQFPRLLEQYFSTLESELAQALLDTLPVFAGYLLSAQDERDVASFVEGNRQFTDCRLALWKLILNALSAGSFVQVLDTFQQRLLVQAVLQCGEPVDVCRDCGLTGKAALNSALRQAITSLYFTGIEKN